MLCDFFDVMGRWGDDEIIEDVAEKQENPQKYAAADHSDGWYETDSHGANDWEHALMLASSYYAKAQYSDAHAEFAKVLAGKKHKHSHKTSLLESKIRSGIKGQCLSEIQLKEDFRELSDCISSHGEQIQFWCLLNEFYASSKTSVDFLGHCRVIILLCASNEYSKFWKMFTNVRNCLNLCNLYVFAGCRAVQLLKSESEMCSGHMRPRCLDQACRIEVQLSQQYPEKIGEAKANVGWLRHRSDECPSDHLPPHACKSDAKFKNESEQRSLVADFINRYPWFFADWPSHLVEKLKLL